MLNYQVDVNGELYTVCIDNGDNITSNGTSQSDGASVCFEAIKTEYDYCMQRSEKLESKVNILLAACAFLFALLTTIIEKAALFDFPETSFEVAIIVLYAISLTASLVFFTCTLINLVLLLKSDWIKRLVPAVLLEKGLPDEEESTAVKYIGRIYVQDTEYNNNILEGKYRKFNFCVLMFSLSTVSLLIAAIICVFI